MTIEIVKGEDNPVAEFFSSSNTPETVIIKDLIENLNSWAEEYKGKPISLSLFRVATILRELEQERDEARDTVERLTEHGLDLLDENRLLKHNLAKAKEMLTMWEE
jgi:hypothetical protein